MDKINQILNKLNANRSDSTLKGSYGELAALEVVKLVKEKRGGFIIHSYSYPYCRKDNGYDFHPGNVKKFGGTFQEVPQREGTNDEIDILYVTPRRVIPIEVKARTGNWEVYDYWTKQNKGETDSSPICQTEKHCRHLYHWIFAYLPNSSDEYIKPITCFVDKAKIRDTRSPNQQKYIKLAILNTLAKAIEEVDTQGEYLLDVEGIKRKLLTFGGGYM